jgi:DNA repair protein RecN (Recombination protein N)
VSDAAPGRLLELAVSDLALIERLRLRFAPGLNVLTGETGAGKSLLIDALGLALGARADSGLVRHGREAARVEALFDRLPEPLVCVREISASGRSVARIDDETVTAGRLAETAGSLVEIHGQHDQQRLLDERWQRDVLDAYGGHEAERGAVADAVGRWHANRASLAELAMEPRELERRLAIHEHEAGEIAAARLRVGEADEIVARLAAARHSTSIARGATVARDALTGDGTGAHERVAAAVAAMRELARLDARYAPLVDRLAGVEAELDDIASTVRELRDDLELDPAALADAEERLSVIYSLERRYGDDEAAVLAYGERAALEAERLRGLDEERARRELADATLVEEIAVASRALSGRRLAAAAKLAAAVCSALESLGFRAGAFDVVVGRRPAVRDEPAIELDGDAVAFDATGADQVVFVLAPNPGEPPRPLSRIASGGELSRAALAVKEVLAASDATPTLVFDEIDSGIGARSAEPVGLALWTLGRRHQVLCVTHLPQIAAYADAHFRIAKVERGGRTVTDVVPLDAETRLAELAEMLGGPAAGEASRAGARELLERAQKARSTGSARSANAPGRVRPRRSAPTTGSSAAPAR